MNLFEIASLLNTTCNNDALLSGVCIDSRKVKPGNLFVAIQGERFDGHEFIHSAEQQGAVAVVCTRITPGVTIAQLLVPDALQALTQIASYYREQMDCISIALTGSNGKTTVKEMIARILPPPAFSTPGNLNNHIGVPLSVLQLQSTHRYAVFELGANHSGEIAHTVAMVKPQVTYINNIAPAHIEGFGSIDGVARAKGEIHQGLAKNGVAVINDDDAYAHFWDPILENKQIIRFSTKTPAVIHARNIVFDDQGCAQFTLVTPQGESSIQLNVPGAHNISNALAAAACTHALGIKLPDIISGLSKFTGVAGRMTFLPGKNNSVIIDDTYNANLRSVLTAIDVLSARQGVRILVFGDMGELGAWSEQHHHDVGVAAREKGIDALMTYGVHSKNATRAFGENARHFATQDALVQDVLKQLNSQATVLVKGSRSSAMECIVQQLID